MVFIFSDGIECPNLLDSWVGQSIQVNKQDGLLSSSGLVGDDYW